MEHNYPNNVTGIINGTTLVSWDNGTVGNYWSDYDGQGAYVIDENNVDHHPFSQPVDISAEPQPLSPPSPTVFIAIIAVAVIVGAGLLVYFLKRKKKQAPQ